MEYEYSQSWAADYSTVDMSILSLCLLTRKELMSSAGGNIWVHYVPYTLYSEATKEILKIGIHMQFIFIHTVV